MMLRLARLVLNVPPSALAARAGISLKELGRIERGEVHPRRETLVALNDAFASVLNERLGTTADESNASTKDATTVPSGDATGGKQ